MRTVRKIINLLSLIAETNILILTNQLAENGRLEEGREIIVGLKNRLVEVCDE